MKSPMRMKSKHYSAGEVYGVLFITSLSLMGFLILSKIITILFPQVYLPSFTIINILLASLFGFFFQSAGSSIVGLIPYILLSRFIFILGVWKDTNEWLGFFDIRSHFFPITFLILLLFFSLSSSSSSDWTFLFPQKEEFPPPLDSKRYYEWVTSPRRRIDRVPYIRNMGARWMVILVLLVITLLSIEEWKKEKFPNVWVVIVWYFIVYLSLLIYSILRMKFTEKELDGYKVSNSIIGRNFSFLLLTVGLVFIVCLLLPWGYSPFNLGQLLLLLNRIFQPKPLDYGFPQVSPLFWQLKLLFLKPYIATPHPASSLTIPKGILIWFLAGLGLLGIFLGIRERFFLKVVKILKEGFVRLFYSFLELSSEMIRGFASIKPSSKGLPKINLRERPKSIVGWIIYYYKVSLKLMSKKGIGKEVWETPYEYARRIGNLNSEISPIQWEITEIFVSTRYKNTNPPKEWIEGIKKRIKEIRKRL
ncbi:MAG: DUF4129 domain-containing protein [bacterium]